MRQVVQPDAVTTENRFQITNVESGQIFICHEGQTLLDAFCAGGSGEVRSGCRRGGCGICKVEIVSGLQLCRKRPMSRAHVSPQDEMQGRWLACRVWPGSDLGFRVASDGLRGVEAFRQYDLSRSGKRVAGP